MAGFFPAARPVLFSRARPVGTPAPHSVALVLAIRGVILLLELLSLPLDFYLASPADGPTLIQFTTWWNTVALLAALLLLLPGACSQPLRTAGGFLMAALHPLAGALVVLFWLFVLYSLAQALPDGRLGPGWFPGSVCLGRGARAAPAGQVSFCLGTVCLSLTHHLVVPVLVWLDLMAARAPYRNRETLATLLFTGCYVTAAEVYCRVSGRVLYPGLVDLQTGPGWAALAVGLGVLAWQVVQSRSLGGVRVAKVD